MGEAAEDIQVIALKLDQLVEKHEKTDNKVSRLAERVLNPETGIFSKVQANDAITNSNKEQIESLSERVNKLLSVCETHDKSISTIENWTKHHEERDNELRIAVKDLTSSMKEYTNWVEEKFEEHKREFEPVKNNYLVNKHNRIWKDKVLWIILGAFLTAIITLFTSKAMDLFKGKNSGENKPRIESLFKPKRATKKE